MKRKYRLKLFVWTNFCPDFSGGLAFALASDEVEARRLIEKEYGNSPYDWGELEIYPVTRRVAKCVSGGS